MSSVLRWGILSTADIALRKVIPGVRTAARCEIVAIASRDGVLARAAAERLGIPTAHASYEALLADPNVDAVYIPLPNHLHAEWTIAALRAGKHVLCEKPLAMTADDAQRMVDVAHESDRHLMEAFMYRHHPSWVAALDLVADGRIGTLTAVQSWFSYFNDDPANIRNVRDYGGGALFDIGCYSVNLSRMVFGGEPVAGRGVAPTGSGHGRGRADERDPRLRGRHRDVQLLDPDRDRPARRHLRHDRPHLDRDPVQHPAGPPDARVPHGGRRSTRGPGQAGRGVPDRRSVRRRVRTVRDGCARRRRRRRSRRRTRSPTCG